jgi:hypothetical protein
MTNKEQLFRYKGNKCACCGISIIEMVNRYGTFNRMLEFNHINPADKDPEYKNIIRRVLSTKQLDEVDKCVLLCRKCHGILHAQNINAELEFTSIIDDQKATQRFKGQMIVDLVEKHFTFLTNERMLLIPYHVEIGSTKPRTLFGVQLEKEELLISFLQDIDKFKTIKVFFYGSNKLAMEAEYVSGRNIILKHDIAYPGFNSELLQNKDNSPHIWIRNGIALTKEGEIIRSGIVTYNMELEI